MTDEPQSGADDMPPSREPGLAARLIGAVLGRLIKVGPLPEVKDIRVASPAQPQSGTGCTAHLPARAWPGADTGGDHHRSGSGRAPAPAARPRIRWPAATHPAPPRARARIPVSCRPGGGWRRCRRPRVQRAHRNAEAGRRRRVCGSPQVCPAQRPGRPRSGARQHRRPPASAGHRELHAGGH
jgi:hypothetical protein